jgi:Tfp pilus assembly protein PilE
MNHDHRSESGIVLLELLIAMTLIVGSITVAHAVYSKLVMKTVQLEQSHSVWVRQKNRYEMTYYLNRLKASGRRIQHNQNDESIGMFDRTNTQYDFAFTTRLVSSSGPDSPVADRDSIFTATECGSFARVN